MIDPAFWNDSKVISLSIPARLLFIGLWNYADDEGFFLDDLSAIKRTLFPDQDFDIHGVFSECSCFLKRHQYKEEGRYAWEISHFCEWQTINRPTASKIKPFCRLTESSVSTHGVLTPKLSKVKLSKDNTYTPSAHVSEQFLKFWDAYPRKKSKGDAEKAWRALKPTSELVDRILAAVGRAKSSQDWLKDNGRFIPYPATWLRAKGWEDEGVKVLPRPVVEIKRDQVPPLTAEEIQRNKEFVASLVRGVK